MLKKLILENWKSFRYAELPIDPLTILIGANASGKSNAIEALDFLSQFSRGSLLDEIIDGDDSTIRRITNRIEPNGQARDFTLRILVEDDTGKKLENYEYSITASASFPYLVKSEGFFQLEYAGDELRRNCLFDSSRIHELRDTIVHHESKARLDRQIRHLDSSDASWLENLCVSFWNENIAQSSSAILDSLEKINIVAPTPWKMRAYSAFSKDLSRDASNIAGFLAALPETEKLRIEERLTYYMQAFLSQDVHRIWTEAVGRSSKDAMLYGEEGWGQSSIEVDARSMSDGTLRFIAILTVLLTSERGSQVIIEDVDDGFHPSRATLLLQAIREIGGQRNIDVLITTHNPALLDSLEQEFLPFVIVAHRNSQTGESLLTPLDKIENLPKLLASKSLGDLATQGVLERNLRPEAIAP